MKLQVRKASGGRPGEQSRHPRPSRASESETTPWHRHRRRSRAPQIPPALTERTMDHGYYGTSHERSKNLLLRSHGYLLLKRSSAGRSATRKDSSFVVNALDMAIKNRQPTETPFSTRISLSSRARVTLQPDTHISLIFTSIKVIKLWGSSV